MQPLLVLQDLMERGIRVAGGDNDECAKRFDNFMYGLMLAGLAIPGLAIAPEGQKGY